MKGTLQLMFLCQTSMRNAGKHETRIEKNLEGAESKVIMLR